MESILFVCTGNYYRSRFAEILFNHLAATGDVPAFAFSRGLRLNPIKNTGVLSPHAITYLTNLGILPDEPGLPIRLSLADLSEAHRVIVLDEKEHRPMMRELFPDWENRVTYWHFEDDYIVSAEQVLPLLEAKVRGFANAILKEKAQVSGS